MAVAVGTTTCGAIAYGARNVQPAQTDRVSATIRAADGPPAESVSRFDDWFKPLWDALR